MKEKSRRFLKPFVMVILLSSISLGISSCRAKTILIPIGDARVVQKLSNGNFEVTPAYVIEYIQMKKELKKLEEVE